MRDWDWKRVVWLAAVAIGSVVAASLAQTPAAPVTPGTRPVPNLADQCPAGDPPSDDVVLQHVAEALKPGGRLEILAVGSATLLGPRGAVEGSFPARMTEHLRALAPGVAVEASIIGGRGLTAAEMVEILRRETAKRHYQLVLWQTGTVEAVRNLRPDDFLQTLSDGTDVARSAGADTVLVDPQFSRFLRANANLDPYEETLEQAASLEGVLLFRRFDLMRQWVSDGVIDLERAGRQDRGRTLDLLNTCLGYALADQIIHAAGAAGH